jgi:hypothetical protein
MICGYLEEIVWTNVDSLSFVDFHNIRWVKFNFSQPYLKCYALMKNPLIISVLLPVNSCSILHENMIILI